MVYLDGVGQVEQPHRQRDGVTTNVARYALAVPSGEDLLQGRTDAIVEAEPFGHACGGEAVRHEAALDLLSARGDEVRGQPQAVQRWAAGADVSQHEAEHR